MQKMRVVFTLIIALLFFAPSSLASQAQTVAGRPFHGLIASTAISRIAYGQSYDIAQSNMIQSPAQDVLRAPSPTPSPTATPTPKPIPTTHVAPATTGQDLDSEALFAMSNAHRTQLGLAPFTKDDRLCQLATERAPEIMAEVAGGYMHKGLYDRFLGYWVTENIVTMGSVESAFDWWSHHGIHKAALEGNFTYSCVHCTGIACAQEFSNFQPK